MVIQYSHSQSMRGPSQNWRYWQKQKNILCWRHEIATSIRRAWAEKSTQNYWWRNFYSYRWKELERDRRGLSRRTIVCKYNGRVFNLYRKSFMFNVAQTSARSYLFFKLGHASRPINNGRGEM
jgi:hypothetical protein